MSNTEIKKSDDKTGICRIIGAGISTINDTDIPEKTTVLNLTDNKICDFLDFNDSAYITSLVLDKNPILSFRGFPHFENLEELSLCEAPISYLSNFRQLAIIAAGPQLKVLNGVDVTSSDITLAMQYGDLEETRKMIVRGWIPKRPSYSNDAKPAEVSVILKRAEKANKMKNKQQTSKKETKTMKATKTLQTMKTVRGEKPQLENAQLARVLKVLDQQEKDPSSVRAVRVLRAIGYDKDQIKTFLRNMYSPVVKAKKQPVKKALKKKSEVDPSSLEGQLQKTNETIQVLATKLSNIRSRNKNYNAYEAMLQEVAGPLFENSRIVQAMDQNEEEDSFDYYEEDGEGTVQTAKKQDQKDSYIKLRLALCDFLEANPSMGDDTLIQLLNDLNENEEEEEGNNEYDDEIPPFDDENSNQGNNEEEDNLVDDNGDKEEEEEEEYDDIASGIGITLKQNNESKNGSVLPIEEEEEEDMYEDSEIDLGITLTKKDQ